MHFPCLSSSRNGIVTATTSQARRKVVSTDTYWKANLGCVLRDSTKHVGLNLGNSELVMTTENNGFACKPSISVKSYDCGFHARNITQFRLMAFDDNHVLNPLEHCGQSEPLTTESQKPVVHTWALPLFYPCLVTKLTRFPWWWTSYHSVTSMGDRENTWQDALLFLSPARGAIKSYF